MRWNKRKAEKKREELKRRKTVRVHDRATVRKKCARSAMLTREKERKGNEVAEKK